MTIDSLRRRVHTLLTTAAILLVAAGCARTGLDDTREFAPPNRAETRTPRTINTTSLAARAPSEFPRGTDETDIISEIRAHLEGITAVRPNEEVLAYVFLHRAITHDEFGALVDAYGFTGGDSIHLELLSPTGTLRFIEITATSTTSTDPSLGNVSGFSVWGTTSHFLRAWNEHADTIRGIGVKGTRRFPVGLWPVIRPGEAMQR